MTTNSREVSMLARQAKALEDIAGQMNDTNRLLKTMNENFVAVGKLFKTWLELDDDSVDKNQLTLEDSDMDFNGKRHE